MSSFSIRKRLIVVPIFVICAIVAAVFRGTITMADTGPLAFMPNIADEKLAIGQADRNSNEVVDPNANRRSRVTINATLMNATAGRFGDTIGPNTLRDSRFAFIDSASEFLGLPTTSVPPNFLPPTTLAVGDIAFSGYKCNDAVADQFSFVLLKAIDTGTEIRFTDYGWRTNIAPGPQFTNSGITESEITFTATSPLSAGQEITIVGTTVSIVGAGTGTAVYTVGANFLVGNLTLAGNGDQLFAYQGSFASPTFIAGIHMNVYTGSPSTTTTAAWDGVLAAIDQNNNNSEKPAALTTGGNALWFPTEFDNVRYDCALGNITTVPNALASLNTPANFIANSTNPSGFILPTGCNYLGVQSSPPAFTLHPANSSICEGANTSFTITATGATSYQWQVDTDGAGPGGFSNISDGALYSGTTTTTLNITGATVAMSGYLYRNAATNGAGTTNSNSASLTVTPMPVNPTIAAKTPAAVSVADGTPVSATFNAGSGGTTCTDDYRYTTNGGGSYTAYTPGTNISTTGLAAGTGFVFIEGRRAGCASACQNSYVVLAAWYVTPLPAGATTLNAGDIAFSGYSSDDDAFSFALLKNIGAGTAVNFTNNGWLSGTSALAVDQQTINWTSNAAYPAGTEIKISALTATLAAGGSAGTVTGVALNLLSTGDQVLAYRGTAGSPTFISGIHMNVEAGSTAGAWDGVVVSQNASALPTGLSTGANAIWIGTAGVPASEFNNALYGTCSNSASLGPINTLRTALNNQANWTKSDSAITLPTGCPYLAPLFPQTDLTATKTNNVSNAAVTGQTWTWTITVTNGGTAAANFPTSSVILSDNLPNTGTIAYGTPTPSIAGVSCSINVTKDLTCTATSPVTLTASGGNFNVQFTAVAGTPGTAPGTYANPRGGGGASVDPNNAVTESDEGNNTFSNSVVVSKANTTTGVTSSQNPSAAGQSVTFTATINITGPGAGTPTGSVDFLDGASVISGCDDVPISASIQCTTSSLPAGTRTITAQYNGDANFNVGTGTLAGGQIVNSTVTWNGSTSTDWNTATNWTPNFAPGVSVPAVNDVIIPNVGAQPNISATDIGIYSLSIANGRTLTITSPRILTIGGSPGGNLTLDGIIDGGFLNLGTGTHVINNAGGTGKLGSFNLATVLSGSTVTLNNNLQAGALTVNAGGSMDITNRTLSLNGTGGLTVQGGATFTTTGSTVVFNGTVAQQAAGIAYNNLTINNTFGAHVTGVTLTGNASVAGALTLTSSDLDTTSAFTLTMPNTATSGPASGATDVVGNVKRTGFVSGGSALSFGNPFNTIRINSGAAPADINVLLAKNAPSTYTTAVKRSYTITPNGLNGPATLRLHYRQTELNGNTETPASSFVLFEGPAWTLVAPTNRNTGVAEDNWLESNAVTTFSEWTMGTSCVIDPIVTLSTDTNVVGDLRYALANVCAAPNNNITFNVPNDSSIGLSGTDNPLVIAKDVNITGPANRLTINGNASSRIFTVNSGINALITNLNLTNGKASQSGAIQNDGNLTLIGMSIFGNNSDSDGGAMRNDGTATIVNSTIANNNAKVDGGGILNGVAPKSVVLLNSTITGNRADSDGNASGSGGGITNGGASANLRIRNSIVSGNFVGTGSTASDIQGPVQFSQSLVGIATGLSPSLAYNGGPTQNFALQSGSNALDNGADATSLAAAVADGVVTSVTVADGTLTSVGLVIRIDNEQMLVTARSTNTLTVTRGFNATTAVAHSNGAAVNPAFDQRGSGFPRKIRTAVDIGAFEAPVVDLSISKSDGGASVAPGGTVSYTLTYANSGGAVATGVVITETVPANTTFNAGASTAGWACVPNNNAGSTCTLAIGSVPAASGSLTATFAVTVVNPVGAGVTQISNTASIADDGASGTDLVPGNNSGSDTTPVTGAPDFSITKSDGGASVAPGGTVSYTLTYANSGNRGASGVVLTETVPANTTFNAGASTAGWVCVPNNNAGSTCTLAIGGLAAGGGNQTATFAVTVVNPLPAGVSQISNTASIADDAANGTDPTPGNNSGSDTTPVTGAPDFSITKSDAGASVAPGGTVSYTLTYSNSGNRGASGVVLTETVPANTTFNAGASTAGWVCVPNNNAGSTCTLAIGGLAAGGGNQTATFAVTVVNPVPAGVSQISNTASIADDGANGTDPTPGNNSGSDTTPVTGAPDFSITKSDAGASVVPGGTVSYTLTYANGGNRGASGVVLTETVPANTTFNAGASTAGWVCAPNNNAGSTCTLAIGGLAAGGGNQTATFAVTVVNPVAAGVSQISNTASIADDTANGADPTPGNNSGSDTTPVTAQPDLSITKSDGGVTVVPGGTVSYTLTYSNSGNQGATGVVLTETVPANTTFNAGASTAGWVCTPNNNAGSTCTLAIGGLAAGGGNQTATFAVTLPTTGLSGVTQISNTASIADDGANGTDPTPGNNSGSDTTPVVCQTITVTNPAVTTGAQGNAFSQSFTQTGGNGTVTFTTASTLPAGLTLASNGLLSGTPTQSGTFPIVVTATDANGCTGTGTTYNLVITCVSSGVVINTNDNGPGSLRQAVLEACTGSTVTFSNTTAGGAVNFFDGLTHTITLATGEIVIGRNLTITGPGASALNVNGNNASRIFSVSGGVTANISGMTITNGNGVGNVGSGSGGGIMNAGTLNLSASSISGNHVPISGGGLANQGTVTITNSTISSNTAATFSGGLRNLGGTMNVINSTVSGNTATGQAGFGTGGAIDNFQDLNVTNSTLSGNTVTTGTGAGGAIWSFGSGTATITSSTITNNSSPNGASGIFRNLGTMIIRNTIVAANQNNGTIPDVSGPITSSGYNLIGSCPASCVATGFGGPSDQTGTLAAPLNPGLNGLGNNGGPTQTHLPQTGSPVIDKGRDFGPIGFDQRGETRQFDIASIPPAPPAGDNSDIGAVEVHNTPPSITAAAPLTRQQGTAAVNSQIATVSDPDQAANTLTVTATPASGTGVTVSGIAISAAGIVTANVAASCTATNSTFTLTVTDNAAASNTATLTVNVTANTPPVLTYGTQNVTAGTTPSFSPATGPTDNGTFGAVTLQSVSPNNGGLVVSVNAAGQVSVTSATLIGTYTVTVAVTDNCGSTTTVGITVNVTCPTITLNPASLPGGTVNTPYNQSVTALPAGGNYTYAVSAGALPAGLSLNPSTGAITGTPTTAGPFNFTITATGWGGCTGSQAYSGTITKANTIATIVTDNPDPSVFGQTVVVNYTLVGSPSGATTPTGNVVVTISGGAETCTGTIAAGTCSLALTAVGARVLTATYAGDSNFNGSSDTENHQVDKANTATVVTSSQNPSAFGQNVGFTATVSAAAPGAGTPTGTVTFAIDGVNQPPATLSGGSVTMNTSTLSVGTHTITAAYNGDANFNTSNGALAGGQVVGKANTTTVITNAATLASTASNSGQPYAVNFTVTPAAPGAGTPTGFVSVTDGTDICLGTVASGTCNLTSTTAGVKTITATYLGDPNFNSSSGTATHTVLASISGNIQQFIPPVANLAPEATTPLAGVTVSITGTAPLPASTTTDANGNYSFGGLTLGGNYTVTPTMAGKSFEPLSRSYTNLTANVTNADFLAFAPTVPRELKEVNAFTFPGQPAAMQIVLNGLGNEKTWMFSLNFNVNHLASPVVTCGTSDPGCTIATDTSQPGKIGITVTPATQLAAGPRNIATVTFQTFLSEPPNTPVTFGDAPTPRATTDANGNPLQTAYTNGFVIFGGGYEGDVAGRPNGSGEAPPANAVTTTDITQVALFVAGTNTVGDQSTNEFQRADSAPSGLKGDGALNSSDIVQVARFAAGLDGAPPAGAGVPAGGPFGPLPAPPPLPRTERSDNGGETAKAPRTMRVVSTTASPGGDVAVTVELDSRGDEVASSFTLNFDPARLTISGLSSPEANPDVSVGADAPAGTGVVVNAAKAARGQIGIVVFNSSLVPFSRATGRQMVTLNFHVTRDAQSGRAPITFGDSEDTPTKRSLSDGNANPLKATYTDGEVNIIGTNAASSMIPKQLATIDLRGFKNAKILASSESRVFWQSCLMPFGRCQLLRHAKP